MFYSHWDYVPCVDLAHPCLDIESRFHAAAGKRLCLTHANPHLGKIRDNISPTWQIFQHHASDPALNIGVAFVCESRAIYALQGHPEFTAHAYHQLMGRVSHRMDMGF